MIASFYFADMGGGHLRLDYYQLLANAFLSGRVFLKESIFAIYPFDLSPVGERLYLSWGPVPALFYSLLDSISIYFFNMYFPKSILVSLCFTFMNISIFLYLKQEMKAGIAFLFSIYVGFNCYFYGLFHNSFLIWEIVVVYSVCFYCLGLFYSEKKVYRGQFFFLLSCLTHPIFHLLIIPQTIYNLLQFGHKKNGIIFIFIIGLTLQLSYNFIRFEHVLEFGENFKFHGLWEDFVYDISHFQLGLMQYISRFFSYIDCSFSLNTAKYFKHHFSLYSCNAYERPMNFLLLVGFPIMIVIVGFIKRITINQKIFYLFLTSCLGSIYFSFIHQTMNFRYYFFYLIPAYLVLILYSYKVFLNYKWSQRKLIFIFFVSAIIGHIYNDFKWSKKIILNNPYVFHSSLHRKLQRVVDCNEKNEALTLKNDLLDLYNIGFTKEKSYCLNKYFFGFSLSFQKNKSCRLDFLAPSFECHKTMIFKDGRFDGNLKEDGDSCYYLFEDRKEIAHFMFQIGHVDFLNYISIEEFINKTPHYSFEKATVNCQ